MSWAWRGRRALRDVVAPAVVASLLVAVGGSAEAAKPKPDLSITKAASSGREVAQGGQLTISWTVKNGGRGAAAKSTTALVLSTDAKPDARDIRVGSIAQKAVKARKTATGKLTAKVPASAAARRYTLLVCADIQGKVKESSERNNCRSATALDVKAQTAPPTSVPAPAPPTAPAPQPATPQPTATETATETATPEPPGPFTTTITSAPADVSPLRTPRFEFTSSQAGASFECRLDDAPFTGCSSPHVLPTLLGGEHAFEVRARLGATFATTARKAWRIEFEAPAPGPAPAAAAAPETKATAVQDAEVTLVSDATAFLYSGADPIQKGVAAAAVKPLQAAVLRGRVIRRNDSPVEGVQVTVLDHPELGRTATRTDGGFDIAVNGGGSVTLSFERAGYVPSQRQLEVPTQDYERVEEIVMVPYEDRVSGVDLAGDELQVAQGSTITDNDGSRRATLLLEPGTDAKATLPDGTTKDLGDRLNIRATEFTIGDSGPAAMPGELPPTSAYTYAVEYSVDEANAQQAVDVEFTKPVVTYVDNLLDFPAGTAVPMGYYDREKAQWIASKDGIVIKILSESGGRAQLDVTGDGVADSGAALAALGIDDAELQKLAELYEPGKSLWRAAITHFTPWDYNWPYGLPDGAGGPGEGGPDGGDPPGDDPCNSHGSIILCENQVLGERAPIAGTPYALAYQSDRVPGRRTGDTLQIPLTGATLPASLRRVDLTIEVAGRTLKIPFTQPKINDSYTFLFDGKDAYGRRVQGRQKVDITLDYVYPAVYRTPDTFQASFAQVGGAILSTNNTRTEIAIARQWSGMVGDGLQAPASALAGWNLDVHHTYDPIGRTLYLGDGSKRSAEGQNFDVIATTKSGLAGPEGMTRTADGAMLIADAAAQVVRRVEPDGTTTIIAGTLNTAGFSGDGGPATGAKLDHPADVAVGPDGAIFVADQSNNRIRRIAGGTITTVAGTGDGGYEGDGGPALQARLDEPTDVAADAGGAVLVIDRANNAIRRIAPDGSIATLAGTGVPGFGGDDGLATKAKLRNPRDLVVRADGNVFVADSGNQRVRRIDPDGTITTVAGNGQTSFGGDGGLATAAHLDTPSAIAPMRDGGLLIADSGHARLRKIEPDGTMITIAGNGVAGTRGDGGPAGQARLEFPSALVLGNDDAIYFSDESAGRIRSVAPTLPTLRLGESTIASDDGRSLYVFDPNGRHLRTVDALTKATALTFGYDTPGRLISVTDGNGLKTTINRDAGGTPTTIVGPYGQVTTLGVTNGYLSSIENPAGDRILAEYDAGGLLTKLTDPRDGVHSFGYDGAGRLTRDTAPDNSFQTLTRTSQGDVVTVTLRSAEGRATVYRVEQLATGDIKRTVSNASGTTTNVVGTNGVVTVTHPDGTVVTQESGPDPRFGMEAPLATRMTMTTPAGLRTVISRNRTVDLATPGVPLSLRSLNETTTVNGRTHNTYFDAGTRRFVDSSPGGRTLTTDVDPQGRALRVAVPGVTPTDYAYDPQGRLERTTQGARVERFAYDDRGRVATITDARSRTTEFTYDLADRPATLKRPDGRILAYTYDRSGNLLSLTPPGRAAHTFAYSSRNVLERSTAPQVDGAPASTTYSSDHDDLVTGVTRPDTTAIGYRYDDAARLERITQPRGITQFGYAGTTGRLTSVSAPGGETVAYGYDGALPTSTTIGGTVSGQISATYDNDFRLASQSVGAGNTADYEYDGDGLLTRAGALTLVRDPDDGLVDSATVGATATEITRNALGEQESVVTEQGATALYGETYTRDVAGRITGKTETRGAVSTSYAYDYDSADRLREVKRNGVVAATYTYDANGNRTQVVRDGEAIPTTGTYDAQDRLKTYGAATYAYTDAGELRTKTTASGTTTYTYDALAALTKVTLPNGTEIEYAIDAAGRRVGVKRNGLLERGFLYGGGLGPVAELDAGDAIKSRFVYGTRTNVPDYMVQGGKTYRFVTDQVGSPRAVVDTGNGEVVQEIDYDEFGRITRDTNPSLQPFRFAGGLYDQDTKLVRFGARDYDPETGRFTTKDPLGFSGGDTNLYGYGLADPVNLTDPSGAILDTIIDVISIGYDLYQIGKSLMNGCGVSGTDVLALGADVVGAIIPFATGGGAGVRALSHADDVGDAFRAAPPVGSKRSPIDIQPGTNSPTNIDGRDYSGHALDRMQGRGIPPSVVNDAISNGQVVGRSGDTTIHYSPDNNVSVVVNSDGRVVTVGYGQFKPH